MRFFFFKSFALSVFCIDVVCEDGILEPLSLVNLYIILKRLMKESLTPAIFHGQIRTKIKNCKIFAQIGRGGIFE